jgi:hypothetical protein
MKIQSQPDVACPRCAAIMTALGVTGTQDIYACTKCGKMEFKRRQERRGSSRKKATDEPIEVVACSGQIGYE